MKPFRRTLLAAAVLVAASTARADATTTWTSAATMDVARHGPAVLLANGDVLVAGGTTAPGSSTSAVESYDPATNTWSSRASMSTARSGHTMTRLLDGRVLVAGDNNAEVYDPALNTWTPTGSLSITRFSHTAALLPSGKVILIGGQSHFACCTIYIASTDIYDPAANAWTPGPSMASPRAFAQAVALADGRVFVAGGFSSYADLSSAEIYDPASNSWSAAASMASARSWATATLLSDGKVLIAGGGQVFSPSPAFASAERYDPTTNSWSSAGNMSGPRVGHAAARLSNNQVLIAGGGANSERLASAELYDPISNTWSTTANMAVPRSAFPLVMLNDDRAMAIGGAGDSSYVLASTELYAETSPSSDSDGDGCSDAEELGAQPEFGGQRDPSNYWDFYDVNGSKNITGSDVALVKSTFGTIPSDPNYVQLHDRSSGVHPWAPSPPDDKITGTDVALVKASFGHSCTAPP